MVRFVDRWLSWFLTMVALLRSILPQHLFGTVSSPTTSLIPRHRRLSSDLLIPQHLDLLLMLYALPCLSIQRRTTNTLILPKLPRRQARIEHLIDLLKRPVLNLWQEKEHPCRSNNTRREPNKAIPGAPIHRSGINKVRCRERGEPRADKTHARR